MKSTLPGVIVDTVAGILSFSPHGHQKRTGPICEDSAKQPYIGNV